MIFHVFVFSVISRFHFSAVTLLVGRQDGLLDCKNVGSWFVGGDDLTEALHVL